jgi:membrane fusion protein, heavy metal efflux system
MRTKRTSFICLLAAMALFCLSCQKAEEQKTEENKPNFFELTNEQLKMMDIDLADVEQKLIRPVVVANGRIGVNPNFEAKISSNVSGRIEQLFVQEGSLVSKGAPILSISSMEFVQLQQDYMKAYSEMVYLEKEYNRQLELRTADVASVADFQSTEAKYYSALTTEKSLNAKLTVLKKDSRELQDPKNAKISLEKTVYSPIAGYVYKLPVQLGMRANPEVTLADVVDLNQLRAEIFLYEKDLDKISEGSEVDLEFINKRIPPVKGTVKFINRSIDDMNKTVMLVASFEKPQGVLILPEMFINAKVRGTGKGQTKMAVPISSLLEEGNQMNIFTVLHFDGKNIVKKVKVKMGESDDKYAQVIPEEPIDDSCKVAVKNLLILDTEFRKLGL